MLRFDSVGRLSMWMSHLVWPFVCVLKKHKNNSQKNQTKQKTEEILRFRLDESKG